MTFGYQYIIIINTFLAYRQQQWIDLVEEHEGGPLKAFEFKWGKNEKVRFPQTFTQNYPGSQTLAISPANIEKFLIER